MGKSDVALVEIEVKQGKGTSKLFIQTQLKDEGREGFTLSLSDGTNVWEGSLSEDDLDNFSSKRKMDFNTYVDQTRAALTLEDISGDLCFEYHLSVTGDRDAQFVWKKHVVEDDIKFQLGSVKLKKSDHSADKLCQILSGCILRMQQLQWEMKTVQSDNERLSMERQNALKRLDKCVTAKEALEKDLYSKFAAVLNSKKERIRHLEENGTSAHVDDEPVPSTSRTSMSPEVEASSSVAEKRRKAVEDSDGVSTDEESPSKKPKRKGPVPPKPSRLSAESSLNLGDDEMEEENKKAPAVRRPRRQPPTRKETPAKPVLPRVSSGNSASKTAGGASRKPSLRKSGSENSNKSSDNLDPDDLLDNL